MATNPEGGLFPGLAAEPFIKAPEVASLAATVMRRWEEFGELRRAVADGALEIAYVFETKPFDPEKEEFKPHTIAKVTKASPLWLSLTGHDLVIQFRQSFWDVFDDHRRQAVLHHELMHIEWAAGKLSLRPHDVEEMSKTARRYGPALPGRRELFTAFTTWQREQAGENVVPLRAVEDIAAEVEAMSVEDQLAVRAAVDAAKGLHDLADRSGTHVDVTFQGRTVSYGHDRQVDPETGEILDAEGES